MRLTRMLVSSAVFALVFAMAVAPTSMVAQQAAPSALPPCAGNYNIVRVSEIKPGKWDTFVKAVAAQQAWYKSKGAADQITLMQIMDRDPATKAYTYSEKTALTSHIYGSASNSIPHDAGYDAFVALFSDSSTIASSYFVCQTNQ